MFKYFQTNKKKVKYNDTIIEEADVVSCLSTAIGTPIPAEYLDQNIMGKMYDAATGQFYAVEEVIELTEEEQMWEDMTSAIMEGVNDCE